MDTCAYTCAGNTVSSSFLSVVFTEVSSLLESGRCGRSLDGRNTLLTTEHSRRHWSTSRCLCVRACVRVCACFPCGSGSCLVVTTEFNGSPTFLVPGVHVQGL